MHRKVFRINEGIIVEGLEKAFTRTCFSRDTTVKLFLHYAIRFAYTHAYENIPAFTIKYCYVHIVCDIYVKH